MIDCVVLDVFFFLIADIKQQFMCVTDTVIYWKTLNFSIQATTHAKLNGEAALLSKSLTSSRSRFRLKSRQYCPEEWVSSTDLSRPGREAPSSWNAEPMESQRQLSGGEEG